jgi:hypothetical protein
MVMSLRQAVGIDAMAQSALQRKDRTNETKSNIERFSWYD